MKRQIGMVLVVLIGLSAAPGCRPTTAHLMIHWDAGKCVFRGFDGDCDNTHEVVPEGVGFCSARNARSACALQESHAGFNLTAYVTGATGVPWLLPSLALYELLPNVVIEKYEDDGETKTVIFRQAAGTCTPPTLTRACLSMPENQFTFDVTHDFRAFTEDSAGRRNSSMAYMRVVQKGKPES